MEAIGLSDFNSQHKHSTNVVVCDYKLTSERDNQIKDFVLEAVKLVRQKQLINNKCQELPSEVKKSIKIVFDFWTEQELQGVTETFQKVGEVDRDYDDYQSCS